MAGGGGADGGGVQSGSGRAGMVGRGGSLPITIPAEQGCGRRSAAIKLTLAPAPHAHFGTRRCGRLCLIGGLWLVRAMERRYDACTLYPRP
jgi:hypothetical protein